MSSDVHAKWMNSAARATSGTSAKRSFSQYSTAFTSWLVTRSIAFTRCASSGAKAAFTLSIAARAAAENGGSSAMPGSSERATSHASSTRTRWRMRPYSEK